MFFVKSDKKIIPVEDLEIFSRCPICGKDDEITEDFWEMLTDYSDFDIYGSQLWCAECTKESKTLKELLSVHVPKEQLATATMKALKKLHSGITA